MDGDLSPGCAFAEYTIEGVAGRGGMGTVYRARQPALGGRELALKVISAGAGGSPELRARFVQEALLAASIDHPHIVPVYDAGESGELPFLAMQWIAGSDLRALIDADGALPPERAVEIVGQVALALGAAHAEGLVHRDVKPANILVRRLGANEHAYLTDFGVAALAGATGLTRPGGMVGTLGYLAPEQLSGDTADARSDLYALGCVLFEALSGEPPFRTDHQVALLYAHTNEPRPLVSERRPQLGTRFDEVVVKAMAIEPGERFASADELRRGLERAVAASAPARRALSPPAERRLRAATTPLVGREDDVEAVATLVTDADVRLTTLVGPGGVGKTRLALAVAAKLSAAFEDRVTFVELAPIGDPALVVTAVARALDVREGSSSLRDAVVEHMRERALLLVLDNFEHVMAAAGDVAHLLAAAPGVVVLATSRAPLRLSGEHEYAVAPLPLPEPERRAAGGRSAAVDLFVERARAVNPRFTLDERTARAVGDICVRLDGLPLAIELAAARVKLLSPEALLARLGDPARVLTGGARDLPAHQQSLEGTIAWSYRLLSDAERRLLRALAVFVGGWTFETAEAVWDGEIDLFGGLSALVDNSLVQVRQLPDGSSRFEMLQVIRGFAGSRLDDAGEAEALRDRHAEHFAVVAAEFDLAVRNGEHVAERLDELDREMPDMRAALAWSARRGDPETELRIAGALQYYWEMRGLLSEGRRWLCEALDGGGATPGTRARALRAAAALAWRQGDAAAATAHCERALELYRGLGDRAGEARATIIGGLLAEDGGDLERALALYREAAHLAEAAGDETGIALAKNDIGYVSVLSGDLPSAMVALEEAVAIARRLDDRRSLAFALQKLGFTRFERGEALGALDHLAESISLFAELHWNNEIAHSLVAVAALAEQAGGAELAAVALAAVDTTMTAESTTLEVYTRGLYERTMAGAQRALDRDTLEAAAERGRARAAKAMDDLAAALVADVARALSADRPAAPA